MGKKNSPPTMKDVSREAGVSLGTVSRVFNRLPVGEENRKRVEDASRKLGYQVNSSARSLRTNRTNTVALIWPCIHNPFYASLAEEIVSELMLRDYRPILMLTDYDYAAEQKCVDLVRQNQVDGIIALTYNPALDIDASVPFVSIDRHYAPHVPCVSSDNYGGGQLAAEKLLEYGCKRLLFLRIGSDLTSEADRRGMGFESVCRFRAVDYEMVILNDRDTEEPFFRFLEEHIRDGVLDYDGIFCNTDRLACHIRDFLSQMGIRVPEDVQIIGYDGATNYVSGLPYCSTIIQPVKQMARAAVDLLLDTERKGHPAVMCLPISFAPGGTTAAPV